MAMMILTAVDCILKFMHCMQVYDILQYSLKSIICTGVGFYPSYLDVGDVRV